MPLINLTPSEACYLAVLVRDHANTPERRAISPSDEAANRQRDLDLALAHKLLASDVACRHCAGLPGSPCEYHERTR
jgi:hypothetical protein